MYTKDKNHRITLRLNDEQMDFVLKDAEMFGVSPSEYIRMILNASIAIYKEGMKKAKEAIGRENDKANSDNIV